MAAKKEAAKKPAAAKAKTEKKPAEKGTSKLATFLDSKKIDPRRLVVTSHKLEQHRPEDRQIKLNRRRAKGGEGEAGPKEERKPRSGRAVTSRAMHAALFGKPVSGPTKSRIVRAVNALLEAKKAEKIDLRALF